MLFIHTIYRKYGNNRDRCITLQERQSDLKSGRRPDIAAECTKLIQGCSKSVYSPQTRKSSLTASEYCSLIHYDASTSQASLILLAC